MNSTDSILTSDRKRSRLAGLLLALALALSASHKTSAAPPEPSFEYGLECAIWVHDAPPVTHVRKKVRLIVDPTKAATSVVTAEMEATARGPKPDALGSSPSKVAVEFAGEVRLTAGSIKLEAPPVADPSAKSVNGRRHRSRLKRRMPGGKSRDYVLGSIIPTRTGESFFVETTEKGKSFFDPADNWAAAVNYQAGLGTVEYDISMAGHNVISQTAGRTELDSAGARLDGVFVWDIVVAIRPWKRVPVANGKSAGKWIPSWDEGSAADGWIIPPSKKERATRKAVRPPVPDSRKRD